MVSILWLVHILSFTCWIKLIIITVTVDLDQISLYGGSIDCRSIGTISPVSSIGSVRSVGFQRRHLLKDTIAKTVQKPWWRNLQTQGVNKTQISVHADTYSPIQTYTRESLEWRWYEIAPWAWKLRDCHPNSSQKCLHMSIHDILVVSNSCQCPQCLPKKSRKLLPASPWTLLVACHGHGQDLGESPPGVTSFGINSVLCPMGPKLRCLWTLWTRS